jgi:hypothetical protein
MLSLDVALRQGEGQAPRPLAARDGARGAMMRTCVSSMTPSDFDALIHQISSVSDWGARVRLLDQRRRALSSEAWTALERALIERARLRDERAQSVLLALAESVAEQLAQRREEVVSPEADWGVGRPLTLGERKTLARKPDRKILERAMGDGHPDVISEVLRNPRLTEADVARLCASNKVRPDVLARVLSNPRWGARARVRRAIALNPRTPPELTYVMLALLDRADLQELCVDERIALEVRRTGLALLDGSFAREGPTSAP